MQYRGENRPEDFCVIVLNRGRRYYRPFFFEQLLAQNFRKYVFYFRKKSSPSGR